MMESEDSVLHINPITSSNAGITESFIVYNTSNGTSNPPSTILLLQLEKLKNTITTFKGKIDLGVLEAWGKFPSNSGKSLTALAKQITKSLGSQSEERLRLLSIETSDNGATMKINESTGQAIGKLNLHQIPATEGILSLIRSCMEMTSRSNTSITLSDSRTEELQKQIKSLEELIAKFTVEKSKEEDRIFRAVKLYTDAKKDRIKELERQLNHEVPETSNPESDTDVEESGSENERQNNETGSRASGAEEMDVEEIVPHIPVGLQQSADIQDNDEDEEINPIHMARRTRKTVIKDSSDSDTDFDEDGA